MAIDVARILLRRIEDLKSTDIAHHALRALIKSSIKKVYLVEQIAVSDIDVKRD